MNSLCQTQTGMIRLDNGALVYYVSSDKASEILDLKVPDLSTKDGRQTVNKHHGKLAFCYV